MQFSPSGHTPLHELPRRPHGRAVDVVVLVVTTLVELVVDTGGGSVVEELVDVEVLVGGATVAVVLEVVGVGGCVLLVVGAGGRVLLVVGVGGCVLVVVVSTGGGGDVVELVVDVVTLVLVGRVPGGRLVVVVLATTIAVGHALGAGALYAAKRPGLSLPILPPNRKQ